MKKTMQATPNSSSSTIKLTATSNTKLTPTSATNLGSSATTLKPAAASTTSTTTTRSIKSSFSKKTTTSSSSTSSSATATASTSSIGSIGRELSPSQEIEEISKKISEHADAIYRTWKYRGLAPTELLDIYTNAATVQVQQGGGGDIFGGSVEAAAAVNATESLQQLVSQFVIKDKEQRGVVKQQTKTSSSTLTASATTTRTKQQQSSAIHRTLGGGGGGYSAHNFGQRTESTTSIMPENIGSKMTHKSSIVGVGGGGSGVGGASAFKHSTTSSSSTSRATGIQKPTATTTTSSSSSMTALAGSPTSTASHSTILLKSSNKNGEHASVKKLAKSSTALVSTPNTTTTTTTATTATSSTSTSKPTSSSSSSALKNNACVKNVNIGGSGGGGVTKINATTSTTPTAATPTTVKRSLGQSAMAAANSKVATAPTLDINLNLDLGFDDLQLDVNTLTALQTQNLKKIKALLKENEHHDEVVMAASKEPKHKTSTTNTKIATKTKRLSPAKSLSEIDAPTTTTSTTTTKIKTSKTNLMNENNSNININNNNNNNNHQNDDVVATVKKIAKSINLNNNNKTSKISNNNNNNNNNNLINNNNNNNNCSGDEPNDVATIGKLISTHDKTSNNKQAGAKITSSSPVARTASKTTIEKSASATTTALKTPKSSVVVVVGEHEHQHQQQQQSIKVINNSISNGSQADQQQQQQQKQKLLNNRDDVDGNAAFVGATTQKSATTIKTNNKKDKKSNESELKKSMKSEKINGSNSSSNLTAAPTLKAAIKETAAATATVIEMAQQQRGNNSNTNSSSSSTNSTSSTTTASITTNSSANSTNINSSSTASANSNSSSSSNMPAPTKFKSGRAAPGVAPQDKNINRPFLTRGSVAERVLMFEKCPDVRSSFLNIKRPDPLDAPPKSLLKAKLHATPPAPAEQRTLQQEIRTLKSVYIPRFYFPHGKPQPQIAQERMLRNILGAFDSFPNNQVTKDELPRILKLCGLPLYWRMPVMVYCQQTGNVGLVERQRFVEFWKQMNVYCHDAASRFVYILSRGQRFRSYIVPEDLVPLVQDVVDTHPGLAFLKEATEFHSRYVHTVIARIFYSVNRSWSGKITMSELKKSDLLEIISLLEEEEDINQIMAFFSYEHFYVIYCKFWELDKDHDLLINQDDLARHSDHALSTRIVERIFSGCVTRSDNKKNPNDEPKMSYTDFVWFLLSEEDKRTPTAIEYWFRCMDLDGDGVLSMYELEYFYEEQQQRMESIGIETLPFEDCLCQMLDMIKPQRRDAISLGDLKRCKMTHVFFDTFFNLEKYLDHEQRDPFASQRDEYTSDWDRFAAQEYELLISEEND